MALYLSCAAVFLRDRIFVTPLNPEAIAVAVEEQYFGRQLAKIPKLWWFIKYLYLVKNKTPFIVKGVFSVIFI